MDDIHFSSKSNYWQTPPELFNKLNEEFNFEIDAAAGLNNRLCSNYFSEENSALNKNWIDYGKSFWLNPPYGRALGKFIKKAYEESFKGVTVVLLVPARPDTKAWHNYCAKGEVRFIKGRLKFVNPTFPSYKENGDFKLSPAPFPSAIVIFRPDMVPVTKYIDLKNV